MKNIKDRIEQTFEKVLWQSKIMVILAVISAMFGALVLIMMGTFNIIRTYADYLVNEHEKSRIYICFA
ncbi:MAG: hypothetical protein COV98_00715 [Candidatus Altarchaeum sp. CG12_big_fil_rev_8_21_14_0_65_33_22]|nr:MAG: hypothetical protein AUK59_00045 [Candidatus Altarchaeum sp. CG2_30_32_3053]PIN68035.1 MAG: hypothetical protein COV98_00715 [Candidatus Altarchaeum sp. CG12_big_fil_rev_8_21_14_0_65_33_22]PIV28968.1 MAG: hypothetical protein COS36_00305 [Candidatus Altarchaeum sp. CG03_land_8_20_14_0_80_32_618]PIX49171.1 MAG: hypothetical protein COZ53_01445 [Candidatus Altarchaeum sp. CG_4_8_14_3_um_filter_33_2054]PIZ30451.1 MAG: hypothetical protein COY41_04015 [Candidatus Altarchaeum sp. CG_4_10_14_